MKTIEHSLKGLRARSKTSLFSLFLLAGAFSIAACGGDSDDEGAGKGGGGRESYLWVKTTEHDLRADLAVSSTNDLVFDEGATVMTTVIGGWAGEGDFGTITARLQLRTDLGEEVGTGTYTLSDSDERGTMRARLDLNFADQSVVIEEGTLELQALDIEGQGGSIFGGKLRRLRLEFDGSYTGDGGMESIAGGIDFVGK